MFPNPSPRKPSRRVSFAPTVHIKPFRRETPIKNPASFNDFDGSSLEIPNLSSIPPSSETYMNDLSYSLHRDDYTEDESSFDMNTKGSPVSSPSDRHTPQAQRSDLGASDESLDDEEDRELRQSSYAENQPDGSAILPLGIATEPPVQAESSYDVSMEIEDESSFSRAPVRTLARDSPLPKRQALQQIASPRISNKHRLENEDNSFPSPALKKPRTASKGTPHRLTASIVSRHSTPESTKSDSDDTVQIFTSRISSTPKSQARPEPPRSNSGVTAQSSPSVKRLQDLVPIQFDAQSPLVLPVKISKGAFDWRKDTPLKIGANSPMGTPNPKGGSSRMLSSPSPFVSRKPRASLSLLGGADSPVPRKKLGPRDSIAPLFGLQAANGAKGSHQSRQSIDPMFRIQGRESLEPSVVQNSRKLRARDSIAPLFASAHQFEGEDSDEDPDDDVDEVDALRAGSSQSLSADNRHTQARELQAVAESSPTVPAQRKSALRKRDSIWPLFNAEAQSPASRGLQSRASEADGRKNSRVSLAPMFKHASAHGSDPLSLESSDEEAAATASLSSTRKPASGRPSLPAIFFESKVSDEAFADDSFDDDRDLADHEQQSNTWDNGDSIGILFPKQAAQPRLSLAAAATASPVAPAPTLSKGRANGDDEAYEFDEDPSMDLVDEDEAASRSGSPRPLQSAQAAQSRSKLSNELTVGDAADNDSVAEPTETDEQDIAQVQDTHTTAGDQVARTRDTAFETLFSLDSAAKTPNKTPSKAPMTHPTALLSSRKFRKSLGIPSPTQSPAIAQKIALLQQQAQASASKLASWTQISSFTPTGLKEFNPQSHSDEPASSPTPKKPSLAASSPVVQSDLPEAKSHSSSSVATPKSTLIQQRLVSTEKDNPFVDTSFASPISSSTGPNALIDFCERLQSANDDDYDLMNEQIPESADLDDDPHFASGMDDEGNIGFDQLLKAAQVTFSDETGANLRFQRGSSRYQIARTKQPTSHDYARGYCVTLPLMEAFSRKCNEVVDEIQMRGQDIEELKQIIEETRPIVVDEYSLGDPSEQETIASGLRSLRAWCSLEAERDWIRSQCQLFSDLLSADHLEALEMDNQTLGDVSIRASSNLLDLQESVDELRRKVETEKQRKKLTQETNLAQQLQLEERVANNRAEIERLKAEQAELLAAIEHGRQQRQFLQEAKEDNEKSITEASAAIEVMQSATLADDEYIAAREDFRFYLQSHMWAPIQIDGCVKLLYDGGVAVRIDTNADSIKPRLELCFDHEQVVQQEYFKIPQGNIVEVFSKIGTKRISRLFADYKFPEWLTKGQIPKVLNEIAYNCTKLQTLQRDVQQCGQYCQIEFLDEFARNASSRLRCKISVGATFINLHSKTKFSIQVGCDDGNGTILYPHLPQELVMVTPDRASSPDLLAEISQIIATEPRGFGWLPRVCSRLEMMCRPNLMIDCS
ncbi:uncharacterized protein BJ171DRAFT_276981 [Polychytrium aggregatum]|uniref:uncharacterized protein n=1 Tax=Polychytrium aggregatum TaxID=110093 RepID=UPI0022FE59E5|nr:uncharacterized protein BJ171DRAFT_276981 [Polychytrium aggregatum]KAI9207521.1 hypothetical protein BJ171DRAFT_276981 [Polychytrium aggregatum]